MEDYQYDVFISHAVEDKLGIANELCQCLENKNIKVWYSGKELSIGDRLTDTIYEGLDKCRFGVVIISPTYISKIWALAEFFALLERQRDGTKVILPVLYEITPQELGARSPLMADMFSVHANKGIEHVTQKLCSEIQRLKDKEKTQGNDQKKAQGKAVALPFGAKYLWLLFGLGVLALSSFYIRDYFFLSGPGAAFIEHSIEQRINQVTQRAELDVQKDVQAEKGKPVTVYVVQKVYDDFKRAKSYYRNEYSLNTLLQNVHSKRNVASILNVDVETLSPLNHFNFKAPAIYQYSYTSNTQYRKEGYVFSNTQPVTYTVIKSVHRDAQHYEVTINYSNNIRTINTTLLFPSTYNDTKHYQLSITALKPTEVYSFKEEDDAWVLEKIE